MTGTLVLLHNVSAALLKDPQDLALKAAAVAALERARDVLDAQKAWQHDAPARLAQARAASLLLRLQAPPSSAAGFAQQAQLLDQAEVAIQLPQLYQSQQIGRLERRWLLTPPL